MIGTRNEKYHRTMKELAPVRKRLPFTPTRWQSPRLHASRLRMAVAIWFLLCASLSFLLFTWTLTSTVDRNRKLENGGPVIVDLHNPFSRITNSRDILGSASRNLHKSVKKWKGLLKAPYHHLASTTPIHPESSVERSATQNVNNEEQSTPSHLRIPPIIEASTIVPGVESIPANLRIPQDQPVVQVINTRFMQRQPHLVQLGLPRYLALCG